MKLIAPLITSATIMFALSTFAATTPTGDPVSNRPPRLIDFGPPHGIVSFPADTTDHEIVALYDSLHRPQQKPAWISLVLLIAAVVVGNLINAVFLRWVASWIANTKITYKDAYLSLVIGSLASSVFGWIVAYLKVVGMSDRLISWLPGSALLLFGGLFGGWFIQALCLFERTEMSFGKALWVLFVTGVVEGTIVLACIGLFFLLSAAP